MEQSLLLPLLSPAAAVLIFLVLLLYVVKRGDVKVPIKGRHVFITGGSIGIGLSIAKQAAAEGARVSILARDLSKLEKARDEIRRATGAEVAIYSADVRNEECVKKALEMAGAVDVLICNHGVYRARELALSEMEDVKYTMDINVMGTFNLIRHALPAMQQAAAASPPRSIAIISSQIGQLGMHGYTHYCASKFALRGLAEALQQEVFSHNIRVSLVFPPDVDTPGWREQEKTVPRITEILSASSPRMEATDVARRTLDGIKGGKFTVTCNREGFMLAIATAGGAPANSSMAALCEVAFAGVMRLVALFVLRGWYRSIAKWNDENQNMAKEKTS